MSKRKSKSYPFAVITTEDGLATAANRYVEVSLAVQARKAAHESQIAALNAAFDAETGPLVEEMERLAASAQLYCEQHRELFPESQRSREYRNARVGFRWNPVRLEKRLAKDTWDAIGERMELLPWTNRYVTYKSPVVNKDLLRDHQVEITDAMQLEAGIQFLKGETFFIDPAFDSVPRVAKEAA